MSVPTASAGRRSAPAVQGAGSSPSGSPPRPRARAWLPAAVLLIGWLVLAGALGALGSRLADVADNSPAALLPEQAQSRSVLELAEGFADQDVLPAVVVYTSEGGFQAPERQALQGETDRLTSALGNRLAAPVAAPVFADDGQAAQFVVPFAGSDAVDVEPSVLRLRELVDAGPPGLRAYVAGPAGVSADLLGALGSIDLMLVAVTSAVILLILVVVYRSPVLPLLVLFVAGAALGVTQGVLYLLARADVLTTSSDVQGILNVLVLGAATDYALLMVARFRTELSRRNRYAAAAAALRGSVGAIVASAGTVALGLLCLVASDLGLNRELGPAGAIGVGCALLATLTLLPAVLALAGRSAFWPRRPAVPALEASGNGGERADGRGGWSGVAALVGRHPRRVWIGSALVLGFFSLGLLTLDASGIPDSELLSRQDVESVQGQRVLGEHFPGGAGSPSVVIARAEAVPAVTAAARTVPGVADVRPYGPDPASAPVEVDGLARVDVVLAHAPDSVEAQATVRALRTELAAVPGADALVGGQTAIEVDFNAAAERDRMVMLMVLGVVFLVLAALLRSLLAPLLLLATVVLSFLAAIGVSAVVFTEVLGFPRVDSTYPLHAFVFLVALGVDYNIFLMHRVREEARTFGTRTGTLRALVATGGVITSAGIVLAATFSALALIPLVLLIQLAFTVAFGVLLDTFLVRSLLVPALTVDLGERIWWPTRGPAGAGPPPAAPVAEPLVPSAAAAQPRV